MNENQYWDIAGTVIAAFACIGMIAIIRMIRKSSSDYSKDEEKL